MSSGALLRRNDVVAAVLLIFGVHLVVKSIALGMRSLWIDEAATLWLASRSAGEAITATQHYQNPPFYYLLMMPWVRLFGTTETAMRSLSVVMSAATASGVWVLARRFFGVETAIYASLLFVASEPQLYYAREARAYALVGALCVGSFHLFLSNLTNPGWRRALALGVVNAAAAYTHYTVVLAFVSQFGVALASLALPARRRGAAFAIAGLFIAFVLFAPWIPTLWEDIPQTGHFWLSAPTRAEAMDTLRQLTGGRAAFTLGFVILAVSLVARVLLRLSRANIDAPDRIGPDPAGGTQPLALATVAAWAVVPVCVELAVSRWIPVFSLRYVLFASVGWMLLVAASVARLPLRRGVRIAVALALGVLSATHLDWTKSRSADWRGATHLALAERSRQTAILIAPTWGCLPFSYYLDREAFPVEEQRLLALQRAGVRCLMQPTEVDVPGLGRPARLLLVRTEGMAHHFTPLLRRMPSFGYVRATTRDFRGGRVIVFESAADARDGEASHDTRR